MVTAQSSFTTPLTSVPYLSLSQYKHAPTGLDTSSLVQGGSAADQDAELANLVMRASSWMDTFCQQILAATVDIEMRRVRTNREGFLVVTPSMWPVLEVRDFQLGASPGSLTQLTDLSGLWIEPQLITVSQPLPQWTSAGPLQFGPSPGYGAARMFCRYTYVNGWPTTKLTANAALGASTIQVADATGIYGGPANVAAAVKVPPATKLTIADGASTETVSVASVVGTTLTLNAPLAFAHTVPTAPDFLPVGALPPAATQAAVFLVSALIKSRGDMAMVLESIGSEPSTKKREDPSEADMGIAAELLGPYRREF